MGNYAKINSRFLKALFKSPVTAILSHWIFQSLLYMDRTEKFFKIGLDIVCTLLLSLVLSTLLSFPLSLGIAFICSHTLNFFFNGHLWGLLKSYHLVKIPPERFASYTIRLSARVQACNAIQKALVYGSLVRGEMHMFSDLDLRLLRKPGFGNGIQACWFLLKERSRALFGRFPLDAYVIDHSENLRKLSRDETGMDLVEYSKLFNMNSHFPTKERTL